MGVPNTRTDAIHQYVFTESCCGTKAPTKYAGCMVTAFSRHGKTALEIGAGWFSGKAAGHGLEDEPIISLGEVKNGTPDQQSLPGPSISRVVTGLSVLELQIISSDKFKGLSGIQCPALSCVCCRQLDLCPVWVPTERAQGLLK